MLPPLFAVIPAEIELTATATPTTSAVVGAAGDSRYAMMLASADLSLWTRVLRPRTAFSVDVSGRYGRALAVTGSAPAPQDLAVRARGRFDLMSSPKTNLGFVSYGFVSSRMGLRASDDLDVRDPFMTNRFLYGFGAQPSFSAMASPLTLLRFDVQYAQAGAIAGDSPDAVGIDTHAVTASFAAMTRLAPRFSAGPVARIGVTHFEHALLDASLTRGPADVAFLSLLGSARYEVSPRKSVLAIVGLTVASPPPQARDAAPVFSPDARFEIRSVGQRFGATAGVAMGYRSLGQRIGFGMDYAGFVDGWVRPLSGGARRDVLAHVVARVRRADTPLPVTTDQGFGAKDAAGNPQPQMFNQGTGKLTTTAFAFGTSVSAPFRLGWSLRAGIDLEFVSAHVDSELRGGQPPEMFRGLVTLGIMAIASTDPRRRLPRDPFQGSDDARGAATRRAPREAESMRQPDDVGDFWDDSE